MIHRLLADADLKLAIVDGVVRRHGGVDFKPPQQVPLEGLADPAVLAVAAQEGRVLVSHDARTMPRHFRVFIRERASPGVILISQDLSIGRAIDNLLLVCTVCEPQEFVNTLCLIPSFAMLRF